MELNNYLNITHIECVENYDRNNFAQLLQSNSLTEQDKKTLNSINRKSTLKGNKVSYKLSPICFNNKLGRFYPTDGTKSIGRIWNEIRRPLLCNMYWDLDMQNCHYHIILWYANKFNLDCEYI